MGIWRCGAREKRLRIGLHQVWAYKKWNSRLNLLWLNSAINWDLFLFIHLQINKRLSNIADVSEDQNLDKVCARKRVHTRLYWVSFLPRTLPLPQKVGKRGRSGTMNIFFMEWQCARSAVFPGRLVFPPFKNSGWQLQQWLVKLRFQWAGFISLSMLKASYTSWLVFLRYWPSCQSTLYLVCGVPLCDSSNPPRGRTGGMVCVMLRLFFLVHFYFPLSTKEGPLMDFLVFNLQQWQGREVLFSLGSSALVLFVLYSSPLSFFPRCCKFATKWTKSTSCCYHSLSSCVLLWKL